MSTDAQNHWPELWEFLIKRIKKPVGHPSYWFYFALVLVGAGGIGVWKAVFVDRTTLAIASNLMTFFPAVAASSAFEIVLNKEVPKSAQTFTMLVGGLLLVGVAYVWANEAHISGAVIGTLSAVVSLVLWWVANAENNTLLDSATPKGAFGDQTDAKTHGDLGDLKS